MHFDENKTLILIFFSLLNSTPTSTDSKLFFLVQLVWNIQL